VKIAVTRKIGMTRLFNDQGDSQPVTLLLNVPSKISRIIDSQNNGYKAVQVEEIEEDNNKNHKKRKIKKYEFKINDESDFKIGDELKLSSFEKGDKVVIVGTGKGKGFSGVIKRHGFSRGPKTHGSDHHRAVGSIGGAYPQRVVLGRRMPGRMGGKQVTVKNLKISDITEDGKIIILSGSIPGPKNSLVKLFIQ